MAVIHTVSLYEEGFDLIKNGHKTVEVRLYDEKRKQFQPGHKLIFRKLPDENDSIETEIEAIKTFMTFEELYRDIGFEALGRSDKTMQWMLEKTGELYSRDEEQRNGAVAIYIKTL